MSNYINNIKAYGNIKISFEGRINVNYEGTHSTTREDKESQGRDTLDLSVDGKMSLEGSAEAIADGLKKIIYDKVHHEEENKEA